jgi:hypothetical protein
LFGQVQRVVQAWLADHRESGLRTDSAVCFDVTNRRIDGACYLFFGESGDEPLLVAKAARTPAGKAVFDIEYHNLTALQAQGMNDKRPTTPRPLGRFELDDTLVALQSALRGTPMKNAPGGSLFSPAGIEQNFDLVLRFWRDLHRRFGVTRRPLDDATYESEVLSPVRRFRNSFRLEAGEHAFLKARFEHGRALSGVELPWMVRHGDFCAANMVLGESGLGVFDWEFPLQPALPLFDLFFFFSSVRFPYLGRHAESSHFESFVSVWWDDSYFNRAVRRRLTEACVEHRIDMQHLPDLLLLSLIQVANMKYTGLIESHGLTVDPDQPVTEQEKAARWATFERPDKDAPFACIQDGAFLNLREVVRRGLPKLAAAR